MSDALILCARTDSPAATQELGAALASIVVDGDLILLTGDLGAGKTCFVQGLGEALDVTERITSPTFTLISVHHGRLRLNHLDVYRLDDPHQILDLDLPELAEHGVTVVEWGEKIGPALAPDRLTIELRYPATGAGEAGAAGDDVVGDDAVGDDAVGEADARELSLTLAGAPWMDRAEAISHALDAWLVPC